MTLAPAHIESNAELALDTTGHVGVSGPSRDDLLPSPPHRLIQLDVLRSFAILLVLGAHQSVEANDAGSARFTLRFGIASVLRMRDKLFPGRVLSGVKSGCEHSPAPYRSFVQAVPAIRRPRELAPSLPMLG